MYRLTIIIFSFFLPAGVLLAVCTSFAFGEDIFVPADQLQVLDPNLFPHDNTAIEIDRIVLGPGAELEIPTFQSIYIRELISADEARIRLMQPGAGGDAGPSVTGGDGAEAKFFIKKIDGHILIEAQGGKGGDGSNGRDGRQGLEGHRGRDGRTLFFGLIYLEDGEDGYPGMPGEKGESGGDGGNGGNGGRVLLYYQDKVEFAQIVVNVAGGEAGKAGRPGIGGLGGNGGAPGNGVHRGKAGPMGNQGESGKPGLPGFPGKPGQASIYQLTPELYQCMQELDFRSGSEVLSDVDFDACRSLTKESETISRQKSNSGGDILSISGTGTGINSAQLLSDGSILIDANGKAGASAEKTFRPGESSAPGGNGSAGGNVTLLVQQLPPKVVISAQGGSGGAGANGSNGSRGADGFDGRNGGLFHKATAGTDGQNGGNGGDGSDGGNGGSGGHIRLVYLVSEGFVDPAWPDRFEVNVNGGLGGAAGKGGKGGQAGIGGKGGKKLWSSSHLPDGANGISGKHGRRGSEGVVADAGKVEFLEVQALSHWIVDEFQEFLRSESN